MHANRGRMQRHTATQELNILIYKRRDRRSQFVLEPLALHLCEDAVLCLYINRGENSSQIIRKTIVIRDSLEYTAIQNIQTATGRNILKVTEENKKKLLCERKLHLLLARGTETHLTSVKSFTIKNISLHYHTT